MLQIQIPNFCVPEIEYTCSVVFTEWLGIYYESTTAEQNTVLISSGNNTLQLNADFFVKASNNWLNKESMPSLPLKNYNLSKLKTVLHSEIHICEPEIPILYGVPEITVAPNNIDCGIDLLGGIFFMLSRYEEIVVKDRDEHDRFSAKSSIAYKENFLLRPIANEYLELLFALLNYLFPQLQRKEMQFQLCPTHDVDVPFLYLNASLFQIIRRISGDIVRRKSLKLALQTCLLKNKVACGNIKLDPFYTFDFIMTESEKHNLKSAFYFLPSSSPDRERHYPITMAEMRNLLKEIDDRGHEIGIHGFYGTYLNFSAFKDDVSLLIHELNRLTISQVAMGGRQHYLQWKNPATFQVWENAGMDYDSTLGFADSAGFRCGTCYEYPVYDCFKRKKLRLKERPLIAMECSVTDSGYMGLGWGEKALEVFKNLKDLCRYYRGNFVILFHNNNLITTMQKDFYKQVLDC